MKKLMFRKRRDRIPDLGLIILILPIALFYGVDSNAESHSFKRIAKEQSIATLDSSTIIPASFAVSPDGRRVAYVEKIGNKQVAVVDGIRQKVYDEINVYDYVPLEFSPDSTKIGFFAREDKRWFFVIDGKEQKEHEPVKTLKPFRSLSFYYSEEGNHYCYAAKAADKQYLVVDGKVGSNEYEEVFPCTFSRDGKRVAYRARERQGEKIFYVIDGVKQKEYGIAYGFTFSPDGKRFAYLAYPKKAWTQRGQRELMVINGREEKEYYRVSMVEFSPDSKRTAYQAEPGTDVMPKGVIVLDGQEISDERAGLGGLKFSPDGKRIAYGATVWNFGTWMTPKPLTSYVYHVIDGKPGKTYDGASIPVFSPDSRRLAYYGKVQNKHMMVIDNEEGKRYDYTGHPVFSADSKRVGYTAKQEKDRFIVVDGQEYNKYESISDPVFSPDSKRVCYLAKKSGKQTVIIDDIEGQFYDEIYPRRWRKRVAHTGIGFSSHDSFHYFAKKGSELIFVQETIEPLD